MAARWRGATAQSQWGGESADGRRAASGSGESRLQGEPLQACRGKAVCLGGREGGREASGLEAEGSILRWPEAKSYRPTVDPFGQRDG